MKNTIEKMLKEVTWWGLLKELAFEYVDEDGKSEEQIQEASEECEEIIESIDPQDDENYIWDAWYLRGKEVALREVLALFSNVK